MRIVLWCYHEAGYRVLRHLFGLGHDLLVVTSPTPAHVPSIIDLSKALAVPSIVAPDRAIHEAAVKAFDPDVGLSVYYPQVIDETIIAIPKQGSFNFHPSLLPRHRGCFSAPWTILEGDSVTGVTCHEMIKEVDQGRILCRSRVDVSATDTAFSLYYKLVDSTLELLPVALNKLAGGSPSLLPQDPGGCYHRRCVPFAGIIVPTWPEEQIKRFIRAMHFPPFPPAKIIIDNREHYLESYEADFRMRRRFPKIEGSHDTC